jgi:hypothetical protein
MGAFNVEDPNETAIAFVLLAVAEVAVEGLVTVNAVALPGAW